MLKKSEIFFVDEIEDIENEITWNTIKKTFVINKITWQTAFNR